GRALHIRPALRRLMSDIDAGMVDLVLVYKVDRLSRSLLDFAKMVELFEQRGVSFVSVTQSFNTSTAMGKLVLNILLSFAEFERAIIAERVRDKIAGAKRKGKFTGGTPVLGYDVDPDNHKLVINQAEARVVRNIFKRFEEVGSGQTIAKELNAKGITTKSWTTREGKFRPGKAWDGPAIYRIIANPVYIGQIKHKEKIYPGEHEAIVTQALWDRAHAMIQHDGRVGSRISEKVPALLKGIIRCGHCDHSMYPTYTRRKGKTYRYYLCVQASKAGYDTCPVKTVAAGEIEDAVVGQLRAIFKSPEMIAQTYLATQELIREAQVQQEMSSDVAVTEAEVAEALRQLGGVWEELFPVERSRIVRTLVEQVSVYENDLDVRIRTGGIHSIISELRRPEEEECLA
ncbi:MAG: recombinase family protein, partial [Armatimonadota bacterium]